MRVARSATKTFTAARRGPAKGLVRARGQGASRRSNRRSRYVVGPLVLERASLGVERGAPPRRGNHWNGGDGRLGGIALWSGLKTSLKAHDEATQANPKYTPDQYSDGVNREHRTNWLIGATAAVGVATLGVSLFATRWSSSRSAGQAATELPPVCVVAHPQGGGLVWQGAF